MVEMGWFERTRANRVSSPDEMGRVVVPQEFHAAHGKRGTATQKAYLNSLRPEATVFLRPSKPNPNPWYVRGYLSASELFARQLACRRRTLGRTGEVSSESASWTSPSPCACLVPSPSDVEPKILLLEALPRSWITGYNSAHLMDQLATAIGNVGMPTFLGGMARGLLGAHGRCYEAGALCLAANAA